jgi:aminoglycoside phosphotransferase family enzyme/predicted kinase
MDEHFDPRLLAFLRDPASYPHHPEEIHELHTHASLVFIVPPFVYKIKKPVDFEFLDFSTLAKRRHFCEREVELNSRLAPGIYLGVASITREGGGFAFGGTGPVVEFAVRMLRMSPEGFLDNRIKAGTAGEAELERVAVTLADFYQKQPSPRDVAEWGTVARLRISTDENFSQTEGFIGKTLSRGSYDAIRAFTESCYELRRALFDQRVGGGWIRDCHGDLHLDHVHVTDDALHIYDCIEFNDRFRHLDVASDAAFLAMDLDYHGRPELGAFFVRCVAELLADPGMVGLMDFYKCYRAYVRGKVESLHAVAAIADIGERNAAAGRARRYFQLALQYASCGSQPVALVFMGRVASGKSTLAKAISHELGWPLVSSDERRKTLAGVPLHQRGDTECRKNLYASHMTRLTYDSMIRDAYEAVQGGHGIILDATFSKRSFRDCLREKLGDRRVKWIVTEVDDAIANERLRQREHTDDVVSDARCEDHDFLNAAFEEPDELPEADRYAVNTAGVTQDIVRGFLIKMATNLR